MEFATILTTSHAHFSSEQSQDKPIDLSSLGFPLDLAAHVHSSLLLDALDVFAAQMNAFVVHGDLDQSLKPALKAHEPHWSAFLGHAWNIFAATTVKTAELKGSDGKSKLITPLHGILLTHQLPFGAKTSCDLGASLSVTDGVWDKRSGNVAANPIRLVEVKKKASLADMLTNVVHFQAQSEMEHCRGITASLVKDLRQPFLMETISAEAFCLQLMLPCQKQDLLAKLYPPRPVGKSSQSRSKSRGSKSSLEGSSDRPGMFVPITLVALSKEELTATAWKSIALAMLATQLRLTLALLTDAPLGTGQECPDPITKGMGLAEPEKPTLLHFSPDTRDDDGAGVGDVVSSHVGVKRFDYYHRSDDSWYNSLSEGVVPHEQRRQPPDDTLLRILNAHDKSLPFPMRRLHGGPNCAILVYPFVEGKHHPRDWGQMRDILDLMAKVHAAGYVHADVLPQNLVFATHPKQRSHPIDWDMARLEVPSRGDPPRYVQGYNAKDFEWIRHPDAREGQPMLRKHDCYSLAALIKLWFVPSSKSRAEDLEALSSADRVTPELIQQLGDDWSLSVNADPNTQHTGSPQRGGLLK